MNGDLTPAEIDRCLRALGRALVLTRLACQEGDVERAEAIADAFHNLPELLRDGRPPAWTLRDFDALFLAPLVARYPGLGFAPLVEEP